MIIAAAIKDENGKVWSVPQPGRHGHVIRLMVDNGGKARSGIQGFVDESGKFYNRNEAVKHAIESGQQFWCYNPGDSSQRFKIDPPKGPNKPRELFSEDLW